MKSRRYFIRGRVQGVGFRNFAQRVANELGLKGYARNLDDGRVEVYASGSEDSLSKLSGQLRMGPRWAEVRDVEEVEATPEEHNRFSIR